MGKVIDELARRLHKAVDDRGIVLWFDPDQAYRDALEEITSHPRIADTLVVQHDGSHVAFRYKVEPYLSAGLGGEASSNPRLIAYVPLARTDTLHALVEIEALGSIAEPGANHDLNTRLQVVAKAALKGMLTPVELDDAIKKTENGAFNLADLDKLGSGTGSSALDLIFETSNPIDVALKFVNDPGVDAQLTAKDAVPQLISILVDSFGLPATDSLDPAAIRSALETFLLSVEYLTHLGEEAPAAYGSLSRPGAEAQTKHILDAVERWRNDARLVSQYVSAADRVQQRLHITNHAIGDMAVLDHIETFRIIDRWRQDSVTQALLTGSSMDLLQRIERFRDSFWVSAIPVEERDVRWQLLETIARLEAAASRIESGLASNPTVKQISFAYTQDEQPWCELDAMQRRLELDFALFSPESRTTSSGVVGDDLERLVSQTQSRYRDVANQLSEAFVRRFADAKFRIDGMLDQRDIFSQRVQPLTGRGKTAYVIVDSLRFEMARELANTAHAAWQAKLTPAAATIPTLTAICKAALVAGANEPLALELKGTQLIPTLSGIEIQNPAARRKRMEQALDHSVVTVGLRDLTPMTAKTRADLAKASFVLITSDEIDQSGENVDHATQAINSVLDDLRRAFGTLSRVGHDKKSRETPIEQIVVVADHGHIFAGDLTEGEKIEPPGPGAHRRIWIGHGGSASNAFLRFQARDIRLGGDLEFATPWNLSAFRTSGGTAYFHGGLSPQELLVPVLTLTRVTTSATNAESAVAWQVSTPKNQITSRSVRVIVSGSAMEILPVPERVRIAVEVRRGNTVLSKMRSASVPLDIESQVVEMERDPDDHRQLVPAQIGILLFGDHIENGQVSLHVIDVDSGIELIAATNISLTVMG